MPLKSTLRKAAWTNRHCSTCDRYVINRIFSVDEIPSWSDKAEGNGTGSVRERSFIGGSSGGDTLTKPAKHVPDKPVLFYIDNISACALLALGLFISSAVSD